MKIKDKFFFFVVVRNAVTRAAHSVESCSMLSIGNSKQFCWVSSASQFSRTFSCAINMKTVPMNESKLASVLESLQAYRKNCYPLFFFPPFDFLLLMLLLLFVVLHNWSTCQNTVTLTVKLKENQNRITSNWKGTRIDGRIEAWQWSSRKRNEFLVLLLTRRSHRWDFIERRPEQKKKK